MQNNNQETPDTLEFKPVQNFQQLNLNPDLLKAIYAFGFEEPSILQQRTLLPIISKRDTIVQAQSGTGKTVTYSIGALQLIDSYSPQCQAVILAPTKDLAQQINKVIVCLGESLKITSRCCVGGADAKADSDALKNGGVQIVVGTPARIRDMVQKKVLKTDSIKIIVLDDADEMWSRGFDEQIITIFENLSTDVQVCLFSATLPSSVLESSEKFMKNPIKIVIKQEQLTLEGIKQFFTTVQQDKQKFSVLLQLYKQTTVPQCIIFASSKERVQELAQKLRQQYSVSSIHGDMGVKERSSILKEFRQSKTIILISTDILNRGIEIGQVSLIINYDLPNDPAKYLQRIGRNGRSGSKSAAINLMTPADANTLVKLRSHFNTSIDELPLDLSTLFD